MAGYNKALTRSSLEVKLLKIQGDLSKARRLLLGIPGSEPELMGHLTQASVEIIRVADALKNKRCHKT